MDETIEDFAYYVDGLEGKIKIYNANPYPVTATDLGQVLGGRTNAYALASDSMVKHNLLHGFLMIIDEPVVDPIPVEVVNEVFEVVAEEIVEDVPVSKKSVSAKEDKQNI